MNFALTYLVYRFIYRIVGFLHDWYVHGSRRFFHAFISFLEYFDRTFAVIITLRHIFEPLYGDHSIVGRIVGPVFRSGRIVIGVALYAILALLFLAAYFAWMLVPPFLLFHALRAF